MCTIAGLTARVLKLSGERFGVISAKLETREFLFDKAVASDINCGSKLGYRLFLETFNRSTYLNQGGKDEKG